MKSLYYIALLPPPSYREQVDFLRHSFSKKFGSVAALKSPPHVTILAPFHLSEDEYTQAKKEFLKINEGRTQLYYQAKVGGIKWFSHKTLYLEVDFISESAKEVDYLRKDLGRLIEPYTKRKQPNNFTPHITIANRDIPTLGHKVFLDFIDANAKLISDLKQNISFGELVWFKHDGSTWAKILSLKA